MLAVEAELMEAARCAARNSYSPYSRFRVGAAVRTSGQVFRGCNIENASLGLTMCAERVAIFSAVAAGFHTLDALAVTCLDVAEMSPPEYRMPCGACRQVMMQFGSASMLIHVDGVGEFRLGDLIPEPFRL